MVLHITNALGLLLHHHEAPLYFSTTHGCLDQKVINIEESINKIVNPINRQQNQCLKQQSQPSDFNQIENAWSELTCPKDIKVCKIHLDPLPELSCHVR